MEDIFNKNNNDIVSTYVVDGVKYYITFEKKVLTKDDKESFQEVDEKTATKVLNIAFQVLKKDYEIEER